MKKFNRTKSYGTISPAWQGASYMQDGQYYDSNFNWIETSDSEQLAPQAAEAPDPSAEARLILMAEDPKVSWAAFRKQARLLLDYCPAKKNEIVDALKQQILDNALAASGLEVITSDDDDATGGVTWGSNVERKKVVTTKEPILDDAEHVAETNVAATNDGPVDLSAWGQGKAEYIFADVQTAIRTKFARQVTEKHDAVELLVDEGVISADAAHWRGGE